MFYFANFLKSGDENASIFFDIKVSDKKINIKKSDKVKDELSSPLVPAKETEIEIDLESLEVYKEINIFFTYSGFKLFDYKSSDDGILHFRFRSSDTPRFILFKDKNGDVFFVNHVRRGRIFSIDPSDCTEEYSFERVSDIFRLVGTRSKDPHGKDALMLNSRITDLYDTFNNDMFSSNAINSIRRSANLNLFFIKKIIESDLDVKNELYSKYSELEELLKDINFSEYDVSEIIENRNYIENLEKSYKNKYKELVSEIESLRKGS